MSWTYNQKPFPKWFLPIDLSHQFFELFNCLYYYHFPKISQPLDKMRWHYRKYILRNKHKFFKNLIQLSKPTLDTWGMGAFFGAYFFFKRTFCLLGPPKQMSLLTIYNENIFLKSQGTRLRSIFAPNKGLELALIISNLTLKWLCSPASSKETLSKMILYGNK